MSSTTAVPRTERSESLDRAGRILVRVGSLVAVVLVVLPALGLAMFSLSFANISEGPFSCNDLECREAILWESVLPDMSVVVAVIVTIVMMLRGGTVSLTLGGIGALIVGSVGLLLLLSPDGRPILVLLPGLGAPAALALAVGAALRLMARRSEHRGR